MAPLVRRTWAPRGKTPILHHKARSHKKVTAVGALCASPAGRKVSLFFRLHANKNLNATRAVEFIEQLQQNIDGKIYLIWDRLLAHRSKKVQRFVARTKRTKLFYFPPYAPELNPIEYAWGYLKKNPLANLTTLNEESLTQTTKKEVCRMRKKHALPKSFLRKSPINFLAPNRPIFMQESII